MLRRQDVNETSFRLAQVRFGTVEAAASALGVGELPTAHQVLDRADAFKPACAIAQVHQHRRSQVFLAGKRERTRLVAQQASSCLGIGRRPNAIHFRHGLCE